jgi:hypothetical protein
MLAQFLLPISLALFPLDGLKNDLVKLQLMGTWRMVATQEDGKVTNLDPPGLRTVISASTISVLAGKQVVWAATYRIDASKTPVRMYYEVTRAPCMAGARGEVESTLSLDGKTLKFDGAILKRVSR